MKKLLSLQLGLLILLSSLAPLAHAMVPAEVIERLEALSILFTKQCLTPNIKLLEIASHIQKNGLSEECWLLLTEINHLESELEIQKTALELNLSCENRHCADLTVADKNLNLQLASLSSIDKKMSCTEEKKKRISSQCGSDMKCAFLSASLSIGGYVAEQLVPNSFKPESCHMGDDSCITRLATGFIRASVSFLATAWDILKLAGNKTGEKMNEFWSWVKGAEDHTSTAQLALAEASADEGIFDLIMSDFPAAMEKIWSGLIGAIKEWLKTNIFCQNWSGVPHLSQCLQPAPGFDCMSCKSMTLGLCSISGALMAEVVPSFLTGGVLAAIKHGANGASKIAKSFVVSNESINTIKNSRFGNKILKKPKATPSYFLSPTRKLLKASAATVSSLAKKGGLYLASTPTGKVLMFPGTVLKKSINAILYPIDNPLTTMGFKAGMRSYEKAFQLGPPELALKASTLIKNNRVRLDDSEVDLGIQEHLKLLAVKSIPHHKLTPSLTNETNITLTKIHSPPEILRSLGDSRIADLNTRIVLKNNLGSFKAPANTLIKLKVVQNPDTGDYMIKLNGLEKQSSQKLLKDLSSQKEFLHNINGHFALQRTELNIEMKSSAKGDFDFNDIKISGKLSDRKPTELPHVDFSEVIRRGAAPVFRGGNAIDKQNSQE
jgi:hypothetical protein